MKKMMLMCMAALLAMCVAQAQTKTNEVKQAVKCEKAEAQKCDKAAGEHKCEKAEAQKCDKATGEHKCEKGEAQTCEKDAGGHQCEKGEGHTCEKNAVPTPTGDAQKDAEAVMVYLNKLIDGIKTMDDLEKLDKMGDAGVDAVLKTFNNYYTKTGEMEKFEAADKAYVKQHPDMNIEKKMSDLMQKMMSQMQQ